MSAKGVLTRLAGPSPFLSNALALMPMLLLVSYWIGGEIWLTAMAIGSPVLLILLRLLSPTAEAAHTIKDSTTGAMLRPGFDVVRDTVFEKTSVGELKSACFFVEIDDAAELAKRHGPAAMDHILRITADRMIGALRPTDAVARTGDYRFAVCLQPVRQLDLELGIQISGRLQTVIEEAVFVDGLTVYVSCSVGFCLRSRAPGSQAEDWLNAADMALQEARQNGPSSIRAYSRDMQTRHDVASTLRDDVVKAIESGEMQAWFQPQLSTDTGRVSGFEALARWHHPSRGFVPPDHFLPALADQGRLPLLTAAILRQSCHALSQWDHAGHEVPQVSLNLSEQDLSDPKLCDTVLWELDKFDLGADRLCIEVLETVVTHAPSDMVQQNLANLHRLGCSIDLDDYGTGHASIASIKRFPIKRIKIDRSFVMKADQDADQQRLVGALLTMAERLDLQTLAEGVETVGEHALLAQLGCDYVQGFGIAKPMPLEETGSWLESHSAKIARAPQIGRRTG